MEYTPADKIDIQWASPPSPPLYRSPSHYRQAVLEHFRRALLDRPR